LAQKLSQLTSSLYKLQQHSQSMMIVLLALLVTIVSVTFTYTWVCLDTPIIDALYFTAGMVTGAGGNEQVVEHAPPSLKLFTVVMMLLGAGILGIAYALLNDFVLGTRFRQFWDAARVPQGGHYIVCGLGGIGMQIVHQLHTHGHEVVVIERDPHNRFLNTTRSHKIPVIQGEANLATTLKAANIYHAAALLAVTSNTVVNLEIALTAKGLAPQLPVIVRSQDPHFAHMALQVFTFESVLSPTELVAPSFAAAALGGKILGNGMTAGQLWIAVATLITSTHPFCNKCIKVVAMAVDFVPLYLETGHQTIHGWSLLEAYLSAGDILYLTIPATRLEQLWRTSPLVTN